MNSPREVVVLGCGGHARVVVDALHRQGVRVAAYVEDTHIASDSRRHEGRPVFASWQAAIGAVGANTPIALAIGDNLVRLDRAIAIQSAGAKLMTVIHDSSVVSGDAVVGAGSYIGPLAIVNARARVGVACIINSGACVEHDCCLGDGVHVAPSAVLCGWCTIGDASMVGAGAAVRDRISVGSGSMIGLGAVVVSDIGSNTIVKGNPARR